MRRFRRCALLELECPRGGVIEAVLAVRFGPRLLGLAGTTPHPGRGLLIPRCRSVHTSGMRAPIDVVFTSRSGTHLLVTAVRAELRPWRAARGPGDTVLELAAGEARRLGLEPGAVALVAGRRARRGGSASSPAPWRSWRAGGPS